MAKSRKPTEPQEIRPGLADNRRAKKPRLPKPEYLDWRTFDLSNTRANAAEFQTQGRAVHVQGTT